MTDGILIKTGAGETWRCTGEVRWLKLKRDPDPLAVVVYGPPPRLQQRWVRDARGLGYHFEDEEWRDVPTVEG